MLMIVRHLTSIAALPFTVAILIPLWIARTTRHVPLASSSAVHSAELGLAAVLAVTGMILFGASLRRFATEGAGTLAPWDPPRELVVRGPYRYVRNPMISGVILILFAEALMLDSSSHLTWALVVVAINAVYIPLLEEPQLRRRFGPAYQEYCRHVPRLIPRVRPWKA